MPKEVPHKNVDPVMVDIRNPEVNYRARFATAPVDLQRSPQKPPLRFKRSRRVLWGTLGVVGGGILVAVVLIIFKFNDTKTTALASGRQIAENFTATAGALQAMKPGEARSYLESNQQTLGTLENLFQVGPNANILNILGGVIPPLKDAGELIGQVTAFNFNLLKFSTDLDVLQRKGLTYFRSDGASFINLLADTQQAVEDLSTNAQDIKNLTSGLKNLSPFFANLDQTLGDYYLQHSAELYEADRVLGSVLTLLRSDQDHHLLLLFQNPSEIRPGGGFIGSYADVTVHGGQMVNLDVRDIYDPDGQLQEKVVPPQPLQTITDTWGARDGNWFFDFPTSARTVSDFLEASQLYATRGITFDAVIGLNINIVKDVIATVGPIDLPDYNMTITADNFLPEVQREVEASADKQAGHPKKILTVLAPLLLQRLDNLTDAQQTAFLAMATAHLASKDVMIYAKDPTLAEFLKSNGLDGSVYELPSNFWGNYLAVVDANVAAGKVDAFISQSVAARIDVDTAGNVFTNLTVTRVHTGNTQTDPWYRVADQNYLQVFAAPGSSLVTIEGNSTKTMAKNYNGTADGYTTNPDLTAIEATKVFLPDYNVWNSQQFGKSVFETWFTTPAGTTKNLQVRYETPAPPNFPLDKGKQFTFIYERQSGVPTDLTVDVFAPFGFKWKESGTALYEFTAADPKARETFTLTLDQ